MYGLSRFNRNNRTCTDDFNYLNYRLIFKSDRQFAFINHNHNHNYDDYHLDNIISCGEFGTSRALNGDFVEQLAYNKFVYHTTFTLNNTSFVSI